MLDPKLKLNDALRNFVSNQRKIAKKNNPTMTADGISLKIGRAKSWLSQVENGRLKSVKTDNLIKAFTIIKNTDYESAKQYLDDEICNLDAQIRKGILDENGKIINHTEYLFFSQMHGHLQYATRSFNDSIEFLFSASKEDIQSMLSDLIEGWSARVVYWINRAFTDASGLFTDEVSMTNLYSIIETSYNILSKRDYDYGVNPPTCSLEQLASLKEKLNDTHIVKPRTSIKPLNEYTEFDLKKVIQYFSAEDYMKWKNHQTYLGEDEFPFLVNYLKEPDDDDFWVLYDDITHQRGLSEDQYLFIIKQLCYHFDLIYKECQYYLKTSNEFEEESNEYFEKCKQLEQELQELKHKLSSYNESPQD